jgi:hypothetical protein
MVDGDGKVAHIWLLVRLFFLAEKRFNVLLLAGMLCLLLAGMLCGPRARTCWCCSRAVKKDRCRKHKKVSAPMRSKSLPPAGIELVLETKAHHPP